MRLTTALVTGLIALPLLTGCVGAEVSAAPPSSLNAACQEGDPCWDCNTMGNQICGPQSPEDEAAGWAVWNMRNGGRSLKVDPSRTYKVHYTGWSLGHPKLTDGQVELVGNDGKWYVFTAYYTD